jgi:hypothetical protein
MDSKRTVKSHSRLVGFKYILAGTLFALVTANAHGIPFSFTNNNEVLFAGNGTSFANSELSFDITNDTGESWSGFRLRAEGTAEFGTYNFMRLDSYSGPAGSSATFSDLDGDSFNYTEVLDIENISVVDQAVLSFSVFLRGGFAPEGMTRYSIYGTPTVGEPSVPDNGDEPDVDVPEPSTLSLLSLSFVGLLYARRRRDIRARTS